MGFIRTSSPETAEKLKKEGFQLMSEQNGMWEFLNDKNKKVSFSDMKNITLTNRISF